MENNLENTLKHLIDRVYTVFGIDRLAKRCANQTPVYWAVEENLEDSCCWLVKFYNQKNELIHTEHVEEWNNLLLSEKALKRLHQISNCLVKQIC